MALNPHSTNHSPRHLSHTESYSSNDVSKMTGVSLRQLQWWDEQGVVSPIQRGHRRMYQLHEVIEVALITELRAKGISLQKIRRVLGFLKNELGGRFIEAIQGGGETHLLTDGENLYLESSHKTIVDILKNSKQPLIGVCISDQVERLTAGVDMKKGVGRERGTESRGNVADAG
ncbi:MAG: MerR family transcriptional regulator [Acidobacteria bacterium]|nr:MerR family transcriptional regulator [Acidobacteriota bacterium]